MIRKSILFLAIVALFFTSCQKDEIQKEEILEFQKSGEPNTPALIDGNTYNFNFEKPISNSKGLIANESEWLETGTAFTMNDTIQYQTIKVYRQPYDENNFFYIMIENLRYNPNNDGSWVYNDDSSKEQQYGRLYDWQTAQDSRLQVYMKMPKTVNGRTRTFSKFGELPTVQDIKDLLETTQDIGTAVGLGIDVNGGEAAWDLYYDAFVAGLTLTTDYSDAYHTLAGWRDNLDEVPNNTEFNNINQKAEFWLSEGTEDAHYPLTISYTNTSTTYQMAAYINVACANRYGFSVRYVFYPFD